MLLYSFQHLPIFQYLSLTNRIRIKIEIKIQHASDNTTYNLFYKDIISVYFNHPSDNDLFAHYGSGFGDWGYDELTLTRKGDFMHEILFSGGGNLKIVFKKFEYNT